MIERLTGELVESSMTDAVVDVNGVGYHLWLPLSSVEKLPPLHTRLTLHTFLSVREDAMVLYGFVTREERELFRLIHENVKGFGPRLALNVLSSLSVTDFCNAIATQDFKRLGTVSGVGRKSAQQLVLDLRGKLGGFGASPAPAARERSGKAEAPAVEDAIAALATLGFRPDEARQAVEQVAAASPECVGDSSTLIRRALARFNAARQ